MTAHRPDIRALLALAEERLPAEEASSLRRHLPECADCRKALGGLRAVTAALGELGRAEHAAATSDPWPAVSRRLENPGLAARLPLGLASAWRELALLARPAVAASAAAGLAGLVLGGWMALVAVRGPADARADETYSTSSLVLEPASGLTGSFLRLDGTSTTFAEDSTSGSDSGGAR